MIPLLPAATLAAAQIDTLNRETTAFLRAQLARAYALIADAADPQSVLDALGTSSESAIRAYAALFGALDSIGQSEGLAPPTFEIFAPNGDGTVTYTAPPVIEEPAPEEPPVTEEPPAP